ncbi:MAG: hypothetical protein AAGF85_20660 [Bacteroidota bacterium]
MEIYMFQCGNHAFRKIDISGNVTTIAGDGTVGDANGNGRNAQFRNPSGIDIDNHGFIYMTEYFGQTLR